MVVVLRNRTKLYDLTSFQLILNIDTYDNPTGFYFFYFEFSFKKKNNFYYFKIFLIKYIKIFIIF